MPVLGNESQLREAMVNLVTNAIKYTPDHGQIMVQLNREAQWAIFSVKDTGYGIATEQQARLFQPFYRAVTKETSYIEGTGLGLIW